MTAPSTFFSGTSDLSALISAANTVHPLSNADLRGVEPNLQGISRRQHRLICDLQLACTLGAIPLNDTTEDRDERASAR